MQAVPKPTRRDVAPKALPARDWLMRVRSVGCVICDARPASAHHIREGQGGGQKSSDYLAVALCWDHHQGPTGWHLLGPSRFYLRYKLDEIDLLAMAMEAVAHHEQGE
jgi:hypothetical protein